MVFRESQKYTADFCKAISLLLLVPIGRCFLAVIFENQFVLKDFSLSFISVLLSLLLYNVGRTIMLERDKKSLRKLRRVN